MIYALINVIKINSLSIKHSFFSPKHLLSFWVFSFSNQRVIFITFCVWLIFNQLQFTYLKAFEFIVSVFLQRGTCILKKFRGFPSKNTTFNFHKIVPQNLSRTCKFS